MHGCDSSRGFRLKQRFSESILYHWWKDQEDGAVTIMEMQYLDTDQMEKDRGITIFSKQAEFLLGDRDVTCLIHRDM